MLTRCGLPWPTYCLADATQRHGLGANVYLPTLVQGWVLWHLGDTAAARTAALTPSSGDFQRAASQLEPASRVRGVLTDGFDSTTTRLRTLVSAARLGHCRRHAIHKLPGTLAAIASPVRQAWHAQCHPLLSRARPRQGVRACALGHRRRHVAAHVTTTAGTTHGERVRRWFPATKVGWSAVLAAPQRPLTSTRLEQAHHASERTLVAMQGLHHPEGRQQALLLGLVHLYNLGPYQRRAQHAGQGGVEGAGGRLPTGDWFLTLQLLTSGGFR